MHVSDKAIKFRTDQLKRTLGLKAWELMAILGLVSLAIILALPSGPVSREPHPQQQCKFRFKQIGHALHNYAEVYGGFPPAYTTDENGNPLHSWRTLLLPYLDQQGLYERIDFSKPWDDPANAEALATDIPAFQCPVAGVATNRTTYLAFVGEDLAFYPTRSRRLEEFSDGLTNTAVVVEVRPEDAIPWMQPNDVDATFLKRLRQSPKFSHRNGTHVLMGDGDVRFVDLNLDQKDATALSTIAGGEDVGDF